jgi:2-methylaconitate cis-trans-isomerase PrpF
VAPLVDYSGNCGNISSGVGPFAIDEGLVKAIEPATQVRIFNTNTKKIIVAHVPVVNGKAAVSGNCVIEGVPGSGAHILVDFPGSEGSVTGRILPTGRVRESIKLSNGQELEISIVDVGNPCVFVRAQSLGIDGMIAPPEIDSNPNLLKRLEEIRGRAAEMVGLVNDWRDATQQSPAVPKMIFISKAIEYQTFEGQTVGEDDVDLVARALSMQRAHKAYPVTGAICTGAAALIQDSLVYEATCQRSDSKIRIGHPAGVINVEVGLEQSEAGFRVQRAAVGRTARRMLSGYVYVPTYKLQPHLRDVEA